MIDVALHVLDVIVESAPYLLLGFVLAGVTKVALAENGLLGRVLGPRGPKSVALAALIGAPLPLCSCSVLPAALALRRQGASKGATSSFLVSVPETDLVSVMLTWGLLGPVMAIVRPVAALVTAFATGTLIDAFDRSPAPVTSASAASASDPGASTDACGGGDCCAPPPSAKVERPRWRRALHYGFVEFFDDLNGPLVLGLVVAGVVAALAPRIETLPYVDVPVVGYLAALLVGLPTYVCATASTPVAAGLLLAGLSPGAALVFLLAGPATNAGSLVVLAREFGRRSLILYLVGVVAVTLLFGFAIDAWWSAAVPVAPLEHASGQGAGWGSIVAAAVFVALVIASAWRTRLVPRTARRVLGLLRSAR